MQYIWQQPSWPNFKYDPKQLAGLIEEIRLLQGRLIGHSDHLSHSESLSSQIDTLVQEAIETSAIEGESLNAASVRSSAARRLGLDAAGMTSPTRESELIVQMLVEAVSNVTEPLTAADLFRWQASLFPERPLFMPNEAVIGGLRSDTEGHPMAVVSQQGYREVVHFIAPPSNVLERELAEFLHWFNEESGTDGLIRAGIAHLWLVTLHPFSDGNGRVTRAVCDRALAKDEKTSVRFYSMSAAIMRSRSRYYEILEMTQKGSMDVTDWLVWFLETLRDALQRSLDRFLRTLAKTRFWRFHRNSELNDRQRKVLNRLLDAEPGEFEQGINASKYKSIASTSKATATRDLAELVKLGCLAQLKGGGRSTRYAIASKSQMNEVMAFGNND